MQELAELVNIYTAVFNYISPDTICIPMDKINLHCYHSFLHDIAMF